MTKISIKLSYYDEWDKLNVSLFNESAYIKTYKNLGKTNNGENYSTKLIFDEESDIIKDLKGIKGTNIGIICGNDSLCYFSTDKEYNE